MRHRLLCTMIVVGMASGLSPYLEAREMTDHLAPVMSARPILHPDRDRLVDRDRLADKDHLRRHRHFRGFFPFWFDEGFVGYTGPQSVAVDPP